MSKYGDDFRAEYNLPPRDFTSDDIADLREENARLISLLTTFVVDIHGDDCRFDHHGYCQAHFLEEGQNCSVFQGRALLGLDTLRDRYGEHVGTRPEEPRT
jgi:hypothetical protein